MKTFFKKTTVQAIIHQNVDRIIKVSIYKYLDVILFSIYFENPQ